ncbi:MAG: bacteriocin, partial [Acidiferrobacteraceae bacterium]|nr:bacteriocin [Acidiferrobacteraceae bacterium]
MTSQTYSRRLKMTKQKQMTEKELDQVSGGPH